MGRLIIDGNSVFEIDEECLKRRRPSADCDVEKYMSYENKEKHYRSNEDKSCDSFGISVK